jgi:nucleoside-diphosphate-sugar epimerase
MQTILGANGTIGSVLAKELTAYTKDIRLVSRNPKKVNETDILFPADLSDPMQVDKAVAGSEIVYLLVGLDYNAAVWESKWPPLMRSVLNACKKYKAKLVFFDNVYMYDVAAIPHMTENSAINPSSRKGAVRRQIAQMVLDEARAGKIDALIARSADFYGPGNDKSMLIELVYKNMKKKKKPGWFVDATKKHSFTFTPDAAKATALLGNTATAYNQVWHLPTDPAALTAKEMASLFAAEMKGSSKISVMSPRFIKILGWFIPFMREMPEMMYQYDRDYVFDSSKFNKQFNFKTTGYQEGVKKTVEGMRDPLPR